MVNKLNMLVTGEKGYLAKAVIDRIKTDYNIIPYDGDVRTVKHFTLIDIILHFASPSDREEFNDTVKTTTTILDGTINMVHLADKHNAKLIFASTMGVYTYNIDDIYCSCKRAMEHYVKANCNKYLILRIPRVYSACRSKGLIKLLRNNSVPIDDYANLIEYMDLSVFVEQFQHALPQENCVYEFKGTETKSIHEISKIYA